MRRTATEKVYRQNTRFLEAEILLVLFLFFYLPDQNKIELKKRVRVKGGARPGFSANRVYTENRPDTDARAFPGLSQVQCRRAGKMPAAHAEHARFCFCLFRHVLRATQFNVVPLMNTVIVLCTKYSYFVPGTSDG